MTTISEETVELSPQGNAPRLAAELLALAADDSNTYRVEDVKTTTSGPRGLAFLVPVGLYELWDASVAAPAAEAKADEKAATEQAKNTGTRTGRRGKKATDDETVTDAATEPEKEADNG